jgi:hypothetical protein
MSPASGERVERKGSPETHHGYDRPAIGLQYFAVLIEKEPTDQAGSSDESDASNQEVAGSRAHRFQGVAADRLRVAGWHRVLIGVARGRRHKPANARPRDSPFLVASDSHADG